MTGASFSLAPRVRVEGEGVLRYQGDGQQKGSLTSGAKLICFLPKNEDLGGHIGMFSLLWVVN